MGLARLLVIIPFVLIFGSINFFSLVWRIIRVGPSAVLRVKKRARPAVLDDPALGRHKFARLKNIRLHYVENGDEDKPLMLFIHGFPEFWYSWRHHLKEFSKDYRAVAMDMRGFGESEKPSAVSMYSMDKLAEDVKDLINYLGYEKAVLVTHDLGFHPAALTALKYPDLFEKIVVSNAPHYLAAMELATKSLAQRLRFGYSYFYQIPYLPSLSFRAEDFRFIDGIMTGKKMGVKKPGCITKGDLDAYKYTLQEFSDSEGAVNFYRGLMRYPPQYQGKILPPTLMIWGTEDAVLGKELAVSSGRYFQDYRVRYLEGASHWSNQEEPELFIKYIREFLAGKI